MKTAKQHQDIIDKRDGLSYTEFVKKNDPDGRGYLAAQEYAKKLTDKFMDKVRDFNNPGHEQALKDYLGKYNQNEKQVHADSIRTACNLLDAVAPELQNQSYEDKIFNNYTAYTKDDDAFISKFRELGRLKIKAEGYSGMEDFINDFWSQHPLSDKARASAPRIITQ